MHSPYSYSKTNCFSNTLNSTGIKIQNQALHLLVMSLQFLSVWNVFFSLLLPLLALTSLKTKDQLLEECPHQIV